VKTWYHLLPDLAGAQLHQDEYHKRVQIEQADVTDREGLLALGKKHRIDRIAHLAVPAWEPWGRWMT